MSSIESFEINGLDAVKVETANKLSNYNSAFVSNVTIENGYFGKIDDLSRLIKKQTGWSDEIVNAIRSPEEYKIYRKAGLFEAELGGRKALLKRDIKWSQMDEFGRTNLQRGQQGLSLLARDGDTIEYHHIGQKKGGPIAEIPQKTHRGKGNDAVLHDKTSPSEIHEKGNQWSNEKKNIIKTRVEDVMTHKVLYRSLGVAHDTGLKSGLAAASITAAITTVDNVRAVFKGEITAKHAFIDSARDTGSAALLGYGTGFITSAIASATATSSHQLIRSLGSATVPAAAISFGIESYDNVLSYARGETSEVELATELGRSAVGIAASMKVAALTGVAAGAVAGPVGGVAGGLVGGMVGYAVATGAYASVLEVLEDGPGVLLDKTEAVAELAFDSYNAVSQVVAEGIQNLESVGDVTADKLAGATTATLDQAEALKEKALEAGQGVLDMVASVTPESVDLVKSAMTDFASNLGLSFNF